MRCITPALLLPLLCAYTAATISSSSSTIVTVHDGTASGGLDARPSSNREITTTTTTPPISSSSTSLTAKKQTQHSPLVFLPQTSTSVCPSRTVNYITHPLPQQCLRTSRGAPGYGTLGDGRGGNGTAIANGTTSVLEVKVTNTAETGGKATFDIAVSAEGESVAIGTAAATGDAIKSATPTDSLKLGLEDEHDSPLDDSKFLSFEEWKKQNLAKVGQSPENVGQGRPQGGEGRRRPINNALDTLGEEGEIELDFAGFGDGNSRYTMDAAATATKTVDHAETEESAHASPARHRSKDAGKTCKERFNYASFDCAATVLKTNPQCKSFQSVLVENKDSYMLNECSAQSKFLIVELCDDILVDTVVVANFEFFSSMFRTFRVSVSDRYPVKADRWKTLGTFEARNTREIQAFLVENPLIWARYLRIEFLTHYGSEFYCPVSLVRVHGTTMMEEFRHQEDVARGEEDEIEELVPDVEIQQPVAVEVTDTETQPAPTTVEQVEEKTSESVATLTEVAQAIASSIEFEGNSTIASVDLQAMASNSTAEPETDSPATLNQESTQKPTATSKGATTSVAESKSAVKENSAELSTSASVGPQTKPTTTQPTPSSSTAQASSKEMVADPAPGTNSTSSTLTASSNATTPVVSIQSANATTTTTQKTEAKGASSANTVNSSKPSKTAATEATKHPPPPPPQPPTQDSFFKTTNKRLMMLETNSSLNIQYIEEQSRILRDAFMQTEKHQLKKTENFLNHLNETVMAELKGFRTQYDQLWQSTVIELEESRARSQREMTAFSTRLTMLADELVWAKRMNVVQSILLLLSLGLFVFASKGKEYMDMPIMQQALKRSQSVLRFRGTSGSFDSPGSPGSPESMRVSSPEFRRNLRRLGRLVSPEAETRPGSQGSDVVVEEKGMRPDDAHPATTTTATAAAAPNGKISNPGLQFEPPTPEPSVDGHSDRGRSASPSLSPEEAAKVIARETQSGPATPSGTRENRPLEWDGAADEGDGPSLSVAAGPEALSPRVRNKVPAGAGRGPSPLRYSDGGGLGANEEEEEEALPSVEDGTASVGIRDNAENDHHRHGDSGQATGLDRLRKTSGGESSVGKTQQETSRSR